ncbi:putative s-adenosylmethionine decarboxylase proenzyme protein [Phaeoacremonium minimum UCRPA7]|uniref:Putative s-adenosylmethionine decarboxylase proenzyme protein n=1 Tax=Phaeoacremonium minimum (strain UCR-PA7) TaxID=1286976 RepID=R8BLD9_PHAM7|nr:putative s-adenosylmethionine decarboxylase proenzyme protein [Phaeoacremonium minimum UCRPA7]EOO00211.1 putative s-adenosylmethionine decarboxylase proenzyme protein [Phaeoacremonium minimum UCRPA7]
MHGGVCLSQSFILFSCVMGILYICLHIQAAYRNEPINRAYAAQHPLHTSTIVVARIDTIAWIISLIAVSVAVSKENIATLYVNLVSCSVAIPAMVTTLIMVEKAARPFDLPWITKHAEITCRVSALDVDAILEKSISRRPSVNDFPTPMSEGPAGPRSPPTAGNDLGSFSKFDEKTRNGYFSMTTETAPDDRASIGGPRQMPSTLQPPPAVARNPSWRRQWSALAAETGVPSSAASSVSKGSWSTMTPSSAFTGTRTLETVSEIPTSPTSPYPTADSKGRLYATPTSSIPDSQKRSPLATTRYADAPHMAIQPEIRVLGPDGVSRQLSARSGMSWSARRQLKGAQEALKAHRMRVLGGGERRSAPSQQEVSEPKERSMAIPGSFFDD